MRTIGGGRRSGRTTMLVDQLILHPKMAMLVPTQAVREMIINQYELSRDVAKRVLVADGSARERMMGTDISSVAVDNGDWVLSNLLGKRVEWFVVDNEELVIPPGK